MDQGKDLCGGISFIHTMVEGKHQYEVGNVMTCTSRTFREGDKLLKINDELTQELPPEMLIQILSSGSLHLVMHQANIHEKHLKNSIRQIQKEMKLSLDLNLDMVSETCLDKNDLPGTKEEVLPSGGATTEEEVLLISMSDTKMAVVIGRGSDSDTCTKCSSPDCTIKDIWMGANHCEIKSDVKKVSEKDRVCIQSLLETTISPKHIAPKSSSSSENITIYYYSSSLLKELYKGVPVVLNITDSNNFLKCNYKHNRAVLTLESCDKTELQSICKDDATKWPFVFYMTSTKENCRRFESAAYSGWFINTSKSNIVQMDRCTSENIMGCNFYIIICSNRAV